MRGNRRRDSKPEIAVRRILHAKGLRYRVDAAPLASLARRRADVVFTRHRIAVFIDGCYWHGCPQHFKLPKTNVDYWTAKIEGNRRRDADTDSRLRAQGWRVLRYWEHEAAEAVADSIISGSSQLRV